MKYTKKTEETTRYLTAYLVGIIFAIYIAQCAGHGFCDARVVEMHRAGRHQRRNRPHRRVGLPIRIPIPVFVYDQGGGRNGCWV